VVFRPGTDGQRYFDHQPFSGFHSFPNRNFPSRAVFAHAVRTRSTRFARSARMPSLPFGTQTPFPSPAPTPSPPAANLPTRLIPARTILFGASLSPLARRGEAFSLTTAAGAQLQATRSPKSPETVKRTSLKRDDPEPALLRAPGRSAGFRWLSGERQFLSVCALAKRAARWAEARI